MWVEFWPKLGSRSKSSTTFRQLSATRRQLVGNLWTTCLAKLPQHWPTLASCWPMLTRVWQNMANIGQLWPKLAKCRSDLVNIDQFCFYFPNHGQHRQQTAKVGHCGGSFANCRPTSTDTWPHSLWGRIWAGSRLTRNSSTALGQLVLNLSATCGQLRSSPGPPGVTFRNVRRAIVPQSLGNLILCVMPCLSRDAAFTRLCMRCLASLSHDVVVGVDSCVAGLPAPLWRSTGSWASKV